MTTGSSVSSGASGMTSGSVPLSTLRAPVAAVEVKAPTAYRTISEVAGALDLPQHVLRFWETKFQQIRPLKRGGGRRYYRPEDVALLGNIKELLYTQGMTIRGVQKMLREGNRPQFARAPSAPSATVAAPMSVVAPKAAGGTTEGRKLSPAKRREVEGVLNELKALREFIRLAGV